MPHAAYARAARSAGVGEVGRESAQVVAVDVERTVALLEQRLAKGGLAAPRLAGEPEYHRTPVFSQVKSGSSRPKWPYAAVGA